MKRFLTFAVLESVLILCLAGAAIAQPPASPLFDSYHRLIADDAGGHVDNFAVQLENEPRKFGYVLCYGPSGNGSGTANFILKQIEDYLVNGRGIDAARLQTVNGGRFNEPFNVLVEFYLLPAGVAPPKPREYDAKLEKLSGKLKEYFGWDGFPDGEDGGPSQGDVTLAGFADILKAQPNSTAYIVAFNEEQSIIGTWQRVAKRDAADIERYGIAPDRIKIVFGGTVKSEHGGDTSQEARVQLWILSKDVPLPLKEAKSEAIPKEAVQIRIVDSYQLKYPENERQVFDGLADVLRANEELSICIISRPRSTPLEKVSDDEPADIDPQELASKWKNELTKKSGIAEGRVILIPAGADESNEGTIEVWVVPRGAALPDPYRSPVDPPSF